MKKILSLLISASILACGTVISFTAIAAETESSAVQTNEVAKKATLTVTVYNEDEGSLYINEHTSFMICGGPDQTTGYGTDGATYLCSVIPSESNPFILNDIDIISNTQYTIIDSGSPDYDGFNYSIDHDRSDRTFKFTDNPNQDLSIYMKKFYFPISSDRSVTVATHGQDVFDNVVTIKSSINKLINSDDFKALDTTDRIRKAKELMKSLYDEELIADYAFDEAENVMSFTYKHGTITGQIRPPVFEDEHKQYDKKDVTTETIPATSQTTITTTTAIASTPRDVTESHLLTELGNDGCWIHLDLVSGVFSMSGCDTQSFSIFGTFERKGDGLYLFPKNASAEYYVLHRDNDHFVSQSEEKGVNLTEGLIFNADNDAFWEKLSDQTPSENESITTGDTISTNANIASDDELAQWAINDYQNKTGITVTSAEIRTVSDEECLIVLKDPEGNILDTYTINPETGIGINSSNEVVDLPQTGMSSTHKAVAGLAAFIALTGITLAKKSKKESER